MDAIVQKAMEKWPNVPACFGWLGLDARGNWYMRNAIVQNNGPFPGAKGEIISHEKLIQFIARNYQADELGRWYFQNGPQRVFVELESTPWIWRISHHGQISSHTGLATEAIKCITDENGYAYLETQLGIGRVHTQDMVLLAELLEAKSMRIEMTKSIQIPSIYHFCTNPADRAKSMQK
jgi:hypothetical protein